MFSSVNKTFEILLIMKSEITIYFAIFYWITFQGPAQHDALITFNYSRTFWRRLFTTSQKLFSCIWTSWFLGVSAKPSRGPYLRAKEARKWPEMTSPEQVWARHQSKMSHLLRISPPAYGQVVSWGSWPNLKVGCIYGKKYSANGLKLPLPSPFEANFSQKWVNCAGNLLLHVDKLIPGAVGQTW